MKFGKVINRIKRHEGFRSKVYKDHLGNDTIGYGFLVKNLELPKAVCSRILLNKVLDIWQKLNQNCKWFPELPEEIQEVIIEMCYQMGFSGLLGFRKTIKFLKQRKWQEAGNEMLRGKFKGRSKWYKDTPKRAQELSNIVRNYEENCESTFI